MGYIQGIETLCLHTNDCNTRALPRVRELEGRYMVSFPLSSFHFQTWITTKTERALLYMAQLSHMGRARFKFQMPFVHLLQTREECQGRAKARGDVCSGCERVAGP